MDKDKWIDILASVFQKYNNTKHSTTGMQPNEAVKPSNHMEVWLNICSKTTYNRKYPLWTSEVKWEHMPNQKVWRRDMKVHGQNKYTQYN